MQGTVNLVITATALLVLPSIAFALASTSRADLEQAGDAPAVDAPSPEVARAHVVGFWQANEPLLLPPDETASPTDCEVTTSEDADPTEQRACIEALLASNASTWDHRFHQALRWARASEDDELVWRIHQRFRPMGRCSHDHYPQIYAAEMAEFCARTGRTNCAVQLYTQTLRHAHPRSSDLWFGGRPASYESPVDALAAHVDIGLFLTGLLAGQDGTDDGAPIIHPHFLALGIANTEARSVVMPTLEAWVADSNVPAEIRRRALHAWASTRAFEGEEPAAIRRAARSLPGVDRELLDAVFEE